MAAAGGVGTIWKVGARRGMAYVEGRELAESICSAAIGDSLSGADPAALLTRKATRDSLLPGTMAVYSDRKGRAFAWQICFDVRRWDDVCALLSATGEA